jgi:hypothetical protein
MFEQAGIAVQNEQGYGKLHSLIDGAFDQRDVEVFLTRVAKSKLRIRDYETILRRGYLGKDATGLYCGRDTSGFTRTTEAQGWSKSVRFGLNSIYRSSQSKARAK